MRTQKLTILLLCGLLALSGCTSDDEVAEGDLIGPLVGTDGYITFFAELDNDQTPYCGESKAESSDSESGSSSSSEDADSFDIESFYTFKYGEQMILRYTYDRYRTKYSLTPISATSQTCSTTDGITCDGVGPLTCQTSDGLTCGLSKTFIFVSTWQGISFTASSGSISWRDGFSLSTDNSTVQYADLEMNMVDASGTIFRGTVRCRSDLN
ncbi:MAG: hypothetical protein RH862_07805 [Leptospiraceae bacterium]